MRAEQENETLDLGETQLPKLLPDIGPNDLCFLIISKL